MPQQKTRGHPPTNTPTPLAGTPNSTTIVAPAPTLSNPIANLPIAPAIVTTLESSNPAAIPMEVAEKEDFGRDRNLKTLLKNLQPKSFSGEGHNVPKILEEWIMTLEDYFALAEYNTVAQGIMARAKLEGSTKLW